MVDILEKYGGWPVVKGSAWDSESWQWMEANRNISIDGLDDTLLFSVTVLTDQRNSSKRVLDVCFICQIIQFYSINNVNEISFFSTA